MRLAFVERERAPRAGVDEIVLQRLGEKRNLPHGLPVIIDDKWRPVEPWFSFFRFLSGSCGTSTLRNYAYDALRFTSFLADRGVDVLRATHNDIAAYREFRVSAQGDGVARATWQREAVVIRGVYNFLKEAGAIARPPWIAVGRASIGRTWTSEPDIRPVTSEQWAFFRDVGLAGQSIDGKLDRMWRGNAPVRSVAGAQLALTTGMRLGEFSSLLEWEVPQPAPDVGASILIEATAKYGKRRRVFIPPATLRKIELYRRTERVATIRRAAGRLWRKRSDFYLVDAVDPTDGTVTYVADGRRRHAHLRRIPPYIRQRMMIEIEGGLSAASLFVSRDGTALSKRSWHRTFAAASLRAQSAASVANEPHLARQVTPHDLRHTFAVVLLKALTDIAVARERVRLEESVGPGSISEHLMINPLLTVQRLLGHASPQSTMTYLRFVEDTEKVVQEAFEEWSESSLEFAEHVVRSRSEFA